MVSLSRSTLDYVTVATSIALLSPAYNSSTSVSSATDFDFFLTLDNAIILSTIYQEFIDYSVFSLDDLLPPIVQATAKCDADRPIEIRRSDTPDGDVIPQSFTIRIDELNLLGETDEEKSFVVNSARNDCEFRIDKLNL